MEDSEHILLFDGGCEERGAVLACLTIRGSRASSRSKLVTLFLRLSPDCELLLAAAVREGTDKPAAPGQEVYRITGYVFFHVKSHPHVKSSSR